MPPNKKKKLSAEDTLKQLSALYPELTPQLKKAADFVMERPVDIALLSIRKSAEAAGTTPSTLTRLANTLGFERYGAFRKIFRQEMHSKAPSTFGNRAQTLQEMASADPANKVFFDFAGAAYRNLDGLFQEETLDKLRQAAPLITQSPNVFILGYRDTFACAHHFAYVGRIAFPHLRLIRGQEGSLISELTAIGKDDVLVAFAFDPYSSETVHAAQIAREAGAKLIAITDSLRSPLAAGAEITFTVENETPHFFPTILASIALVEALLAECITTGGPQMIKNIENFENTLRRLGGYYAP
ncbi:MurR/RpiR family transcriptional regulator [Motiliproteus sp. SC1-56]|uniref:MurR/RpiR family transcriptional regulator n=1 Tax=Motiliproteus sp. SC1-56 TaxID=2799565 RepID=UPI001A8C150B|nr:MurR/RpiR family transcriptional regulator [Motiliproteus sp. SC1-56]